MPRRRRRGAARPLPRKRNRKRPPPPWRRLPGPRAIARGALRGLRRSTPVLVTAAILAVIATGAALGYRFVTTSDRFAVAEVEIRGNDVVSERVVLERLDARGENLFTLDSAALERALERDPWIARAEVSRRLPRTLVVEVAEHEAAALVDLGGLYLVDASGVPFKRASLARGEGAGLPVVTGISRDDYLADPEQAAARVAEALETAAIYADTADAVRPALGEVHWERRRGVTVTTYETATSVRLGRGSEETLRARLDAFDAAWAALTPDERAAARVVHADNTTRPDHVTVSF